MHRPHLALAALLLAAASGTTALACTPADWKACAGKPWVVGDAETPIGERWWPHLVWGAQDEAGATNWYARPEVVQRALAEARTGKTYRLVRPAATPAWDERAFVQRESGAAAGLPLGANAAMFNADPAANAGATAGAPFDGLGRLAVSIDGTASRSALRYYNGATQADVEGSAGVRRNGVEKLHPIAARAVLVDLAGAAGGAPLAAGREVTMADVREALARQGLSDFRFLPGDGVFFRTGWGALAASETERYRAGAPGLGMEVARWLSDTVQAGVVGSDAWTLDAMPAPDAGCVFCVQAHLLVRHGIVKQTSLDLDALAADKAWRFLYLFNPVPVIGAGGSAGAPLAIR